MVGRISRMGIGITADSTCTILICLLEAEMSWFGDETPAQEVLETVRMIQKDYKFSDEEIRILLLKVSEYFYERSFDSLFEEINHRTSY
jgi:hypothetical protein